MFFLPNSKWTWAFTLVALVQACVVLAFEWFAIPPVPFRASSF